MDKEIILSANIQWEIGLGKFDDEVDMVYLANTGLIGKQSFAMSMTVNDFQILKQLVNQADKKLRELKK